MTPRPPRNLQMRKRHACGEIETRGFEPIWNYLHELGWQIRVGFFELWFFAITWNEYETVNDDARFPFRQEFVVFISNPVLDIVLRRWHVYYGGTPFVRIQLRILKAQHFLTHHSLSFRKKKTINKQEPSQGTLISSLFFIKR